MVLSQLKPSENLLYGAVRRFHAIILCEGKRDVDVLKAVIRKLNLPFQKNVGITDCGGLVKLKDTASIMAALARISRKLEVVGVLVDANKSSPPKRVEALINSLRAKTGGVGDVSEVEDGIFVVNVGRLKFIIYILGDERLPFQKHEMEDYLVDLMIENGQIDSREIAGVSAKSFLEERDVDSLDLVESSGADAVKKAFIWLVKFLRVLQG